jgi:hypothetical protein
MLIHKIHTGKFYTEFNCASNDVPIILYLFQSSEFSLIKRQLFGFLKYNYNLCIFDDTKTKKNRLSTFKYNESNLFIIMTGKCCLRAQQYIAVFKI